MRYKEHWLIDIPRLMTTNWGCMGKPHPFTARKHGIATFQTYWHQMDQEGLQACKMACDSIAIPDGARMCPSHNY